MSYLDDVEFLREYTMKHFVLPKITDNCSLEDFRKKNAHFYAASMALKKCYDNLNDDPVDYLDDLENEFSIESIFLIQDINKKFFQDAAEAVGELKRVLKKRRN